jgi:fucokinase
MPSRSPPPGRYHRAMASSARPRFDLLVLTASDARQAGIYERTVGRLVRQGSIAARDLLVVPDPGGRRVGSGGATLEAAIRAAEWLVATRPGDATRGGDLESLFAGRRVLVVHSGGESRRLPAFAAVGKVLMPLDAHGSRGGPRTMLEAIVESIAATPCDQAGQFAIATGDALVDLDGVDFAGPGVVGVAQLDSLERGSRHGVFVADPDGGVRDMLQKPTADEARAAGAICRGRRLLVDTGVLSLDPAGIARWLAAAGVQRRGVRLTVAADGLLAGVRSGETGPVELYHEVLKAIPTDVPAADFNRVVGGPASGPRRQRLGRWRRGVRGMPFSVRIARGKPFLHPGTTREYLDIVARPAAPVVLGSTTRTTAIVGTGSTVGGVVVESSMLDGLNPTLRGRNLVVGVPGLAEIDLDLQPGECVFMLPIRDRADRAAWFAVAHHEHDDFKTTVAAGGTLGAGPIESHPVASWIAAGFEGQATSLRELPLWSAGRPTDALRHALAVLRGTARTGRGRWSLAEALDRVDVDRLLAHRDAGEREHVEQHAAAAVAKDRDLPIEAIAATLPPDVAARVADAVAAFAPSLETGDRARLLAAASRLDRRSGRDDGLPRMREALAMVGEQVAGPVAVADDTRAACVLPDQAVWCASPVRIDLAGGWSDTPPVCVDLGGAVVNAAVLLHGKQPLQAVAKLLDEPKIVVHSVDLGASRTFTRTEDLLAPADPSDWTTLPRMALRLAGVTPKDPATPLATRLESLGGGLVLTLYSAVPKGSGLGTSSILGATVLACLDRLFADRQDRDAVVERTSVLEQLMTTRGGWQDQVGGVFGGIKIARTTPGPSQRPRVEAIHPPPGFIEELQSRSVLLFSGEKRLARDILEKVVGRYLAREPEAVGIVHALKDGAEAMVDAIRTADFDAFAARLAEYWTLKRSFDPAATNARIDAIADTHRRDLAAWELPGAGGGGFLMLLARDASAAARIRQRVDRTPPNPLARRFPLEIDPDGLRVTVL